MYQLQEMIEFVDEKTAFMHPEDLILVVGDFNISNRKFNDVVMNQFKERAKEDPGYEIFFNPNFDCLYEYEIMKKIMSKTGLFNVDDLKTRLNDEFGAPPTFGGVFETDDGMKFPIDTALPGKGDLMTEQSLDFIFKLSRNDIPSEHREDYKNTDIQKLVGMPTEINSDLDNQGLIGGKSSLRIISDSI